jgi:murein DD-endopeptidase MepM/ murein hydrolase activator NlpD
MKKAGNEAVILDDDLTGDARAALAESTAWVWPLPRLGDGRRPEISDGFSADATPSHRRHVGVDMMYRRRKSEPGTLPRGTRHYYLPEGTHALAARDGVVGRAETIATGGVVRLDHGHGLSTVYHHLASIDVVQDQRVTRGQPLGLVGGAPRTSPGVYGLVHLHYEIWAATAAGGPRPWRHVDPAPYLRRWAVLPTLAAVM